MEVTDIAKVSLDEDDRHVGCQAVPLANRLFLGLQAVLPRTMRNQGREFEINQAVPKELRFVILEFKPFAAKFRAADGSGENRRQDNRKNEAECDQQAVRLGNDRGDGRAPENRAYKDKRPRQSMHPVAASLAVDIDDSDDGRTADQGQYAHGISPALRRHAGAKDYGDNQVDAIENV